MFLLTKNYFVSACALPVQPHRLLELHMCVFHMKSKMNSSLIIVHLLLQLRSTFLHQVARCGGVLGILGLN